MGSKAAEVSAFEAKTRLSELLRETERGRSFVIHRQGKPVARKRIPGTLKIRELVEEGRRYCGVAVSYPGSEVWSIRL